MTICGRLLALTILGAFLALVGGASPEAESASAVAIATPCEALATGRLGEIMLVSSTTSGVPANQRTSEATWSSNGTGVFFHAYATNLGSDVDRTLAFRRDLGSCVVQPVDAPTQFDPSTRSDTDLSDLLSPDQTMIALGPSGRSDGSTAHSQGHVMNLATGAVVLFTSTSDGSPADGVFAAWMPESRRILFWSRADNLSPDGRTHLFMKDLVSGQTRLLSTASDGSPADNVFMTPAPSPDGTKLAFISEARNLGTRLNPTAQQVYVKDLLTGIIKLVSSASDGTPASVPAFHAFGFPKLLAWPYSDSWSPDSRKLVFQTTATNLVSGTDPLNGISPNHFYVKNVSTEELTIVDANQAGNVADGDAWTGSWAPDSVRIAFTSGARNLLPFELPLYVKNTQTAELSFVRAPLPLRDRFAASAARAWAPDGSRLLLTAQVFREFEGWCSGLYVVEVNSSALSLVTSSNDGTAVCGSTAVRPAWSPDGTKVLFISSANGFVPGDLNNVGHAFIKNVGGGATPPPPPPPPGNRAPVWIDAPENGTRFDLLPGESRTFTATARDPDGSGVFVSTQFFTPGGSPRLQPDYVACETTQDPFDTTTLRCTVGPTDGGLAVIHIDGTDPQGLSAGERRFLVGASPYQYVALGDSYSAGEGIDPYFRDGYEPSTGTQPGNIDNRCHRSTRAYAERIQPPGYERPLYVLASGGGRPGSGQQTNKFRSDQNVRRSGSHSWVFWACSGAIIGNVLRSGPIQNEDGFQEQYAQLDNPSINFDTDLVTITISGNDVGFTRILRKCAESACATPAYEAELNDLVDRQRSSLVVLYRAILEKTFGARVLALGYPQIFPESPTCFGLRPWRGEEAMLRRVTARLNDTIRQAADEAGVEFVSVAEIFEHHEVCGDQGAWINGYDTTLKKWLAGPDDESFHPTLIGQLEGYAAAINNALLTG